MVIRVYQENTFFKTELSPTHQASAKGLVWRNQKGFFISTKFKESSSHFCFDHFYIVDFHSGLTSQVSLQTNPQADAWWVGLYLFLKKMFFGTPYGHSAKTSKTATTFIPSIQIFLESLCMIFKENGHDIDCHVLAPASTCSNKRASTC